MKITKLLVGLLISSIGFAQSHHEIQNTSIPHEHQEREAQAHQSEGSYHMIVPQYRTCLSAEMEHEHRDHYHLPSVDVFESELARLQEEYLQNRNVNRAAQAVIQIPIIIHVVHNGENIGSGANISQAQVESQIRALNEDYRKKINTPGHNTHPDGADVEIEFVPALRDKNGNTLAEPGIHRYNGGRSYWERNPVESILKPATSWDPNQYFNIWTCAFGGDLDQVLGYAQFPSLSGLSGLQNNEGAANTDGVIIGYQFFGTEGNVSAPYNGGRTTTHEVGHWLGLRHIWGDGGCNVDDYCDDTPRAGEANYNCSQNNSCTQYAGNDMIENYMDYTPDACMNIFTEDQKNRMLTVMNNSIRRKELLTSTVHLPEESAPIAAFSANATNISIGQSVSFADQSTFDPTSWSWTFTGAETVSSTDQNPSGIVYNSPGCYEVILEATNSHGTGTETKSCYINVSSELAGTEACDCEDNTNIQEAESTSILSYGNGNGYYAGRNSYGDRHFAEIMYNSGTKHLKSVNFEAKIMHQSDANAYITFNVRNVSAQGQLEGIIHTQQVPFSSITNDGITEVLLSETILIEDNYFVDLEIRENASDTIAFYMSPNRGSNGTNTMYLSNGSNWYQFDDVQVNFYGSLSLSTTICDNYYTETVNACANQSFTWADGTVIDNVSDVQTHISTLVTPEGCDSILSQTLNIIQGSSNTVEVTVCYGEIYTTPEGTELSSDNLSVVETLMTANGCDSLVTYNLTILDEITNTVEIQVCVGKNYTTPEGTLVEPTNGSASHTETLQASNGCDSLVTYIVNEYEPKSTIVRNVCIGSTIFLLDGTPLEYIQNDQDFEFTFTSYLGCDSIVTEEVRVVELDNGISSSGNVLVSAMYGVDFQWFDCSSGLEIPDATLRTFVPSQEGKYKVRVSLYGCEAESVCYNYTGLTSIESLESSEIKVYPNPSSDIIYIEYNSNELIQANVYDLMGRLIETQQLNTTNQQIDISNYAEGDYILKLSDGQTVKTVMFSKQ